MLPNLSSLYSLTLAPEGPCRPCGPGGPGRTAATGSKYGATGWQLEPCPICLDPLGQDSEANPWAPNKPPYAGPCCANEHACHKGCIRHLMNANRNARCPECRAPILPDFLYVKGTFTSSYALKGAVRELLNLDPTGATPHPVHGPIGEWDVSRVKSMEALFENATSFNQPLNSWIVSEVENMRSMFENATSFNQPLDQWDVSNVTTMTYMFQNATYFNQPLNSWIVSDVTSMNSMFKGAACFNQPLDQWDVSKVTSIQYMFWEAVSFNQDLCCWQLRDDVDTSGMFTGATAFNRDPATRPPRRESEADAGRDCPPLPRGLRRQRSID